MAEHIDVKIRRVAEQHSRDPEGARRGRERRDGNPVLEPLHQFLEDEDGASDWRVESGAEASAGPGRNQHTAVRPTSAEHCPHQMGKARSHLDTGALTAECQTSADREQPTDELHRN